jgi:uncharacterized membrane protein YbhN (UPF0104 family)
MRLTANSTAAPAKEAAPRRATQERKGATLATLAKVAATLLIFGYVGYTVDLSSAWRQTTSQDPSLVALAAAILLIQLGLGGVRWFVILRSLGAGSSLGETLKLFYVSIFFNSCVLSGIGGDLVRTWLSYRSHTSAKVAVTSVVLDRVAALAAVALLVLVTAPILLSRIGVSVSTMVPVVLSAGGLVGIVVAAQLDRLPERALRLRGVNLMRELGASIRTVFLRPASALPLLAVATAGQCAMAVATYALAVSLRLDLSFLECLALMQPVTLLANLPISIGGWGVRETAMITLLGMVGVPSSSALVLSIQLGLLTLVISLPGGLVWLALRSRPARPSVMAPAEAQPSP